MAQGLAVPEDGADEPLEVASPASSAANSEVTRVHRQRRPSPYHRSLRGTPPWFPRDDDATRLFLEYQRRQLEQGEMRAQQNEELMQLMQQLVGAVQQLAQLVERHLPLPGPAAQ